MDGQILRDWAKDMPPAWYEIEFGHDKYNYCTTVMTQPQRWYALARTPADAMLKCMGSARSGFGSADVAKVTQIDWAKGRPVDEKYYDKPKPPQGAPGCTCANDNIAGYCPVHYPTKPVTEAK